MTETLRAATLSSPDRNRKLHVGHFAFMRTLAQGVDMDRRAAWNRYLRIEGEHTDLRVVNRTVNWIRSEFAAAARRHNRHGVARLVMIDVTKIPDLVQKLPTLEDFAIEHGLEDFSEREQLAHYTKKFGNPSQQQSRRGRLVKKQLEAIHWLEELVAQPPLAGDALASWLDPVLVSHLEAAKLFTVRQLIEHINGTGLKWWRSVPAIGEAKSEGILAWLALHEATIGLRVGTHVQVKRSKLYSHELARVVPKGTAIVPLEKLIVPHALNGEQGAYRAPRHLCLLRANTDYEAVLIWIKSKHSMTPEKKAALKSSRGIDASIGDIGLEWLNYLSHTQRSYLKEAERFMLWAIVQKQKPLSSMTLEDCNEFRDFLANPTPVDRWCGQRGRQKWSPLWRPFEGPLSESAAALAITILKSLYKFLVDQCYLVGNPWNGVTVPKSSKPKMARGRSFTQAQWTFILGQAEQLSDNSANMRLRFALNFIYATGLRLSEVVAAKVDDLNWVTYPGSRGDDELIEGYELTVLGKGQKQRIVPVSIEIASMLATYLVARGLDPDPEATVNRGAHLLGVATDIESRAPWSPYAKSPFDPKAGITASRLHAQIKAFFVDCSHVLANTDEKSALRLAQASTHWLRHTHGSHSVAAGTPLDIVQQNLGHASIDTTTIYVTTEDRRRMKSMQGFWEATQQGGRP